MKPKVGRNFTSERGEGVKGEVKNISLHWLQGIFETVPKDPSVLDDSKIRSVILSLSVTLCMATRHVYISRGRRLRFSSTH